MMFYYWTPGSHIPWHNDSIYNGGITIHLNENWNPDHGGIFLFEDGNNIRGIYPKINTAVEQFGKVHHCVCPTTTHSDVRRTIQFFF
jgi:Rps23 Pro-64 3,4-dihydroxylase Tpa1-like proline 4-hydroxylase